MKRFGEILFQRRPIMLFWCIHTTPIFKFNQKICQENNGLHDGQSQRKLCFPLRWETLPFLPWNKEQPVCASPRSSISMWHGYLDILYLMSLLHKPSRIRRWVFGWIHLIFCCDRLPSLNHPHSVWIIVGRWLRWAGMRMRRRKREDCCVCVRIVCICSVLCCVLCVSVCYRVCACETRQTN